jgi:hypothetical protein
LDSFEANNEQHSHATLHPYSKLLSRAVVSGERIKSMFSKMRMLMFSKVILWLHTKALEPETIEGSKEFPSSNELKKKFELNVLRLMQLWVLGDKLLIPGLHNRVMEVIDRMWYGSTCGTCFVWSTI